MRIFITADWEGIAGIVDWRQEESDKQLCRKLMTAEVNAAVEGALAAGATEIVVNDSHGDMRNILIEQVNPKARLISGSLKELSMVQGVNEQTTAAIFIGYHSKMGTCKAILDHTYSGGTVNEVRINGVPAGETTINAGVCGYYNVPVVLVSGDDSLAPEVTQIGASHVVVKQALSRYSAVNFHPEVARTKICDGVKDALNELEKYKPYKYQGPVTMELDLINSAMAQAALLIPGFQQLGPRTVAFTHQDYLVAFKALRAAITLAGANR